MLVATLQWIRSASAPRTTAPTNASGTAVAAKRTTAQQAQAAEDQIFGGSHSASQASNPATAPASDSMFEEVSTQLENRTRLHSIGPGKRLQTKPAASRMKRQNLPKATCGNAPKTRHRIPASQSSGTAIPKVRPGLPDHRWTSSTPSLNKVHSTLFGSFRHQRAVFETSPDPTAGGPLIQWVFKPDWLPSVRTFHSLW